MKCKRLCAAILSLVMIISLLPTTALAAEENDVWSKEYGEIRVYLDSNTEADYKELGGDHIRIMSEKYFVKDGDGKGMRACFRTLTKYWPTTNAVEGITAKDIDSVVLAKNKIGKPSDKISIPIGGNTTYKVKVSQGHHQGNMFWGHEVGGYDYLRIDITKREHHTVTYKFFGIADVDYPTSVTPPVDTDTYTETSVVDLKQPAQTTVAGKMGGKDGTWTFSGWTQPDGVTFTDNNTKFAMPDENVTVTGTWKFTPTTSVYVYFRTVDSANNDIDNVEGVTYNNDDTDPPHHWATLGKLETKTSVTDNVYEALGKEVVAQTGFEYYTANNNRFPLDLITWEKVSTHNGAQDYVSPGTKAWHLDGKVTAYRAIYCDSDGTELKGFAPNTDPKYYLEGTKGIALTDEEPVVPGKVFDGWDTTSPDVTVADDNTFSMPGHDVTFTAKWKPGALKIEKILDEKSPAAGNIFSFTVTPQGSTTSTDAQITGAGTATIPDLLIGKYTVTEDANTAAVDGYRCTTQYRTDNIKWQDDPITVTVPSNNTATVYVRNSYTPITADLIDNNIIIKHSVNGDPAHGDDSDSTAHIVNKDAKISYQATLDMQSLKFGDNPEHADAVSTIKTAMSLVGKDFLWDFMYNKDITMFDGSKVNLHVKFSDKLVNPTTLDNITLESGWFKRDPDPKNKPTYDETTKYWTIPCVIKNADDKPNTNDSIITLSGITLPLTADAQDELRSDTALDVISKGYIDGTIKISVGNFAYTLKLEGKSKEAPAQNTAKLKLDVPTYTVTYTDGANGSAFKDQVYSGLKSGVATPAFNGTPERDGYTFNGWKPTVKATVTNDATYTATWTRNSSHDDDDSKTYYYFAIEKVDAQDGHALNDAKFELYQRDNRGNKLAAFRKTTSHWGTESGIALFSVSATKTSNGGSTWYYREITAPEGYVLDSTEHKITKNDFSTSQNAAIENVKTVRNYRGTTPDLLNGDDHFAYVVGYQDGCVHPNALITRAETATIFFRLLKDDVRDDNLRTSNTFADVPNDYWANTAISTMAGLGIVQGYNSTAFDPNVSITRAEFAAICARFDTGKSSGTQTFSDIKGHWAEKYIERAAELGWIKGFEDGTFRPNDCITRAQAMTMINRVLNRIPEENGDLLSSMNVWPDCNPGDWFYLAVQEATNSHDFKHKAGNYETWTGMKQDPDWTRYEN